MGSCVSSLHENGKLDIPPSPIKEKQPNGHRSTNDWSAATFRDLGSKEETFFDSRPWLESDCEDDFFSVNGDFTPSRGSTPVHNSARTPQVSKTSLSDQTPGSIPEPSPTGKKMKLAELFRQSSRKGSEDQCCVDQQSTQGSPNIANGKMGVKTTILDVFPSKNGTPYVSGTNSMCSSERTANEDSAMEKPMKSVQCCLPSLVSCHNFSERKKKMSRSVAVNA